MTKQLEITARNEANDGTAYLAGIDKLRKRAKRGEHANQAIALQVAASSAIERGASSFVIAGNSFGHAVWNIHASAQEAASANFRLGAFTIIEVTPALEVFILECRR